MNKSLRIRTLEDTNVFALRKQLESLLTGKNLTSENILNITVNLMQLIQKYPGLSGTDRKRIVIKVLEYFVNHNVDDKQEKRDLELLIQLTVPSFIDTIVSVDKGELVVNTKKCFSKLFKCCS